MIVHDFLTGAWTELHPGQPYSIPFGGRYGELRPNAATHRDDLRLTEPLSHVTIVEARPRPYDWSLETDDWTEDPSDGDGWLMVDL